MFNSQGKTTSNLLAGLVTLALISGVTLPKGIEIIENAQETTSAYNVKVLQNQVEIYRITEGEYPSSLEMLVEKGYLRDLPGEIKHLDEEVFINYNPTTGEVFLK